MKTLITKLFAGIFIIALISSCASVTDAGMADQPVNGATEQLAPPAPDATPFGDSEIDPILPKPE